MNKTIKTTTLKIPAILFSIFFLTIGSLFADENSVLEAAKQELKRSMEKLSKEDNPPYFIGYAITESKKYRVTASFGRIVNETESHTRILDIDLRVGSPKFDNTHIIRGNDFSFGSSRGYAVLPLDDDKEAIQNAIWYATDGNYKASIERFEKALTNKAVKIEEEDTSADFSYEKPYTYKDKKPQIVLDKEFRRNQVRELSTYFAGKDWLYIGMATFTFEINTKYFISSEGSELVWYETFSRIMTSAKTKSEDGMSLPLYESYFAFNPKDLPETKLMYDDAVKMTDLLDRLRNAPSLQTTYSGPAILSGEASGVFFHEIFGHRIEGHREKDPNSSQTFKNAIGEQILPEFIDVVMDPTISNLNGIEVSGNYMFDDEGIKSQKVVVAEDGKFNNFLMSRSPIENFSHSNGHGRREPGYKAVSRQSNLIVKADKSVSIEELKDLLRKECKEQDKEYGLYFDVVQGGFTFTGRTIPNAFNVNPLVVYKIYADGRPDELIRGVDLIGTPLTTFKNIINAADDLGVFNGICGAESGGVPVSASSPSLLVSVIEVQKKQKSQAKLPVLDAPLKQGGTN